MGKRNLEIANKTPEKMSILQSTPKPIYTLACVQPDHLFDTQICSFCLFSMLDSKEEIYMIMNNLSI